MTEGQRDDLASALELIKQAHVQGGQPLTRTETLEFIKRPINLGRPTPLPRGKRGPATRRTQYDAALDRRKPFLYRLEKLPGSGAAGRSRIGNATRAEIWEYADKVIHVKPHVVSRQLATAVQHAMQARGRNRDIKTIRNALKNYQRLIRPL